MTRSCFQLLRLAVLIALVAIIWGRQGTVHAQYSTTCDSFATSPYCCDDVFQGPCSSNCLNMVDAVAGTGDQTPDDETLTCPHTGGGSCGSVPDYSGGSGQPVL